jgi:DNA-binding NtrC family response regulator
LRPADRVALYSQESIELLLPEINPENVDECVRSLVAPQNGEAILVAGIAMYPSMATSSEKLISESRHAVQNASASVPVRFANTETSTTWLADTASHDDNIFMTTSPAMRSVIQIVTRVTKANMPVLLQGEAGTGKDVLARLIHENGSRRHKPMICVNCAVIPGTLLEGMLFGHEQRSFTGTNDAQKGLFEAAHGGTLLLDEIGEMTLATQVALLRVLESKRIRRVGGKNDIDVDVRVLATTRGDLEDLCDAGRFLRELYFRLSTMTIVIPPLRNRREDITPLVGRFLEQASKMNDSRPRIMAHDAMELLERYTWPGNIRELRNAIDRAVMIAQGDTVTTRDLPERIQALRIPAPPIAALTPPQNAANRETRSTREVAPSPAKSQFPDKSSWSETDSLKVRIEKAEAHFILDALQTAGWKQKVAAKQLSIPLRTLQYKMRSLGIAKSGQKIGEFKSGGSK